MQALTAKSRRTRERIMECAGRLFYEKGILDTPQQEIADTAGLNRGLIYHYFDNKEGIAAKIFEQFVGSFYRALNESCLADEENIVLASITRGRVIFKFLLSHESYKRFFSQLIKGGIVTEVIEQSVLRDFAKECEYLGLDYDDEQMRLHCMVLASVECRLMSTRFDDEFRTPTDDIISLYNRIHLNLLGMGSDEMESLIARSIAMANRISFVEGAPFEVTPGQFVLAQQA